MASTRYNYDLCRVIKQNEILTGPGRYALNVPGNGVSPAFVEDPYIRMQKWGANLGKNPILLESELMGLRDKLGLPANPTPLRYTPNSYPTIAQVTHQPRATHPAWEARTVINNTFDLSTDYTGTDRVPLGPGLNMNSRLVMRDEFENNRPY